MEEEARIDKDERLATFQMLLLGTEEVGSVIVVSGTGGDE